ncbi:hypothetical protein H2200_003334 [Cladophialophora chaetospira]|uniref:DUF7587 domain-containing protein n=1 Tax=Cladophialophora chaetospira TaxID=386627 RepID=A0AA38XHA4_9EURO|nr:hypothetical protein H2200_003334 [Cladophialophora chaetospira]
MTSTSNVPRYLFRVYSPGSDGLNSVAGFTSQAKQFDTNNLRTLSQLSRKDASSMLRDHVLWKSYKERNDDLLISFTSSFLFALQHSVRKINQCWRTTEQNCYICIIDTSKYPSGTFSWTVDLLNRYDLDGTQDPLLQHRFHEAEYLAQCDLTLVDGSSVHVSFGNLLSQGGLYEAIPELAEEIHRPMLWNRLREFRATWYQRVEPVTQREIQRAHRLAICFGGQWVPVIMIWALAIRARPEADALIEAEFEDGFYGEITTPFLFTGPTPVPPTLRELVEWERLMGTAYKAQQDAATGEAQAESGQASDGEDDEQLMGLAQLGL